MNINGMFGGQGLGNGLTTGKNDRLEKSPAEEFLAYMEKSPAERMRDMWLRSRGLSDEDLQAMAPAEREAVEKQMAEDIKRQMQEEAQKKALKSANARTLPMASFLVLQG